MKKLRLTKRQNNRLYPGEYKVENTDIHKFRILACCPYCNAPLQAHIDDPLHKGDVFTCFICKKGMKVI